MAGLFRRTAQHLRTTLVRLRQAGRCGRPTTPHRFDRSAALPSTRRRSHQSALHSTMTPSFQHSAQGPPRSGPSSASGPAAVRRSHATGLRALLLGALWVMALAVLAKFSGAFKEIVLASRLGTSVMVDHFVLAFTLATWPGALLASVLTVSVTPVLARARASNATALQPFIGQVWGATLLLATAVALAVAVALPWLIGPAAVAHGAVNALIGGVAWLGCLCAVAGVVLMSFQRQIGTLLEGLPSLVLGGALLLAVAIDELTLPMALMLGMVLQLACLVWVHVRTVGPVVLLWPPPPE